MSSRTCAWIVTSRAVVGSSAIRSAGLQERAIAIMTRWRMPPENSWGYSSMRLRWRPRYPPSRASRRRSRAPRLLSRVAVQEDGLHELVADGVQRREARHGLLEDHGDVLAADAPHLFPVGRERREVDGLAASVASRRRTRSGPILPGVRHDPHDRPGR